MQESTIDPLQTEVFFEKNLPQQIVSSSSDSNEAKNIFYETIAKPAMIITTEDEHTRYYLRAIGWEKILLIKTGIKGGAWYVQEWWENTPSDRMSEILKVGKLIYEHV